MFDPITIVLADDHALVRGGLRRVLEDEEDLQVVAEAGDADEALRIARELRPRIVLLDVTMPGTPSIDAIPSLLGAAPGCAVVMLTMHDDAGFARDALAAGASGYVLKDAAARQLVDAVRAVVAGRNYVDPGLGARVLAAPPPRRPAAPAGELAIGSTFAGHRIDGVAGRGGMGIVYRATDLALGRPVALKLMAPRLASDHVFRARFESECRLGRGDRPSPRRRGLPRRRGGRPAVRHDALRRRHGPARDPARRGPARAAAGRPRRRTGRGRARRGAPPRPRPSRREARERARRRAARRRARVPQRLRPDQGASRRERADRDRPRHRHGRLHRAGAGPRPRDRRSRRRVRARLRALPVARRDRSPTSATAISRSSGRTSTSRHPRSPTSARSCRARSARC